MEFQHPSQESSETDVNKLKSGYKHKDRAHKNFVTHVENDNIVMGNDLTEDEIDEATSNSKSEEETHEKLLAILERKKGGE